MKDDRGPEYGSRKAAADPQINEIERDENAEDEQRSQRRKGCAFRPSAGPAEMGWESYSDVLVWLGTLGLRPPVALMEGPNVEVRQRARALIREALNAKFSSLPFVLSAPELRP